MKKATKKSSEDIPYEFWKKYDEADHLKREELLQPIIKKFLPMVDIKDEKMREHILNLSLRSYFDDLIDYFYCKENNLPRAKKK